MNPIGLTITIIVIFIIILAPRRVAVLGVISGVIYITQGQAINLGGINLVSIRFIEVAGFYRVIARKEFSTSRLNEVDKYFLLFISVYLFVFLFRSMMEVEPSTTDSKMYHIGLFIDGILSYLIFRGLIKDPDEFRQFLKDMVFVLMPFTMFMIIEGITGKNLFSILGGVPQIPAFRDGYYRCQGSFRHSITAGSLGATLMPFFIFLYLIPQEKSWGKIGIILCVIIVIASHSSGPLMGFAAGIIAWLCWFWRKKMRIVRWGIVCLLISLHLTMKSPVWFIIARISDVIGGDGWHRANLIDKFIKSFKDWWLLGMPREKTAHWAATQLSWGSVDITNKYVLLGVNGGLISLILYAVFLKKCYQPLGNSMKIIRNTQNNIQYELLLWGLGSTLFAHIVNHMGVRYFDQSYVIWYMTLAIISSQTAYFLSDKFDYTETSY